MHRIRLLTRLVWDTLNPFNHRAGGAAPLSLLTAIILVIGKVIVLAGAITAGILIDHHFHHETAGGGAVNPAQQAPLPTVRISGGNSPATWSLDGYVVRVHNQGDSSSCVGQTLATIEEITNAERGRRISFSSGFIWNALNRGINQGLTYRSAFDFLQNYGDAPLWADPNDGLNYQAGYGVPAAAYAQAAPYRATGWHALYNWDQNTMRAYISSGIPIAFTIQVLDSFYQQWGVGYVPSFTSQYGFAHFWHSMTIIAYDPTGVTGLNSWGGGPYGWGGNGRFHMTWQFLIDQGAYIVAPDLPLKPYFHRVITHPKPRHVVFPAKLWNAYTTGHHQRAIPYRSHVRLTYAATLWVKHGPKRAGAITHTETWHPAGRRGVDGYETDTFRYQQLYFWPRHAKWAVRWTGYPVHHTSRHKTAKHRSHH